MSELAKLQAENARLIALLELHGIEWHPRQSVATVSREPEPSRLSTAEKVTLFGRLFRGRTDAYPVRWEGKTSGKSGYTPACANERRAGLFTVDPLGFVTTDTPCTWFDPEAYKLQPIFQSPALGSATIEVTLPISPRQCLVMTHRSDFHGYIDVGQHVVDEVNRRHIAHCDESFISHSEATRPI